MCVYVCVFIVKLQEDKQSIEHSIYSKHTARYNKYGWILECPLGDVILIQE
jgi:hypothetical protein